MAQKWGPGELSDYNEGVDETAEERAKRLEHHAHECTDCGRVWDCDGADCVSPLDFFTICDGCEYQKEG